MYEFFISAGLGAIGPSGIFSFIVPDRFGYNEQFVALRRKILRQYCLDEMLYRAPFPNVTVDTAIFRIRADAPQENQAVAIGEFDALPRQVLQRELAKDSRARFVFQGADATTALINRIKSDPTTQKLGELVSTTSGVGAKSKLVTAHRVNNRQIQVLKGESIYKYVLTHVFYFDFTRKNITGRTTDRSKLGCSPKILIRKTGDSIVATLDESGVFPEQSLYFTYGETSIDLYCLLGLLNSRLMNFIFFHSSLTNRASIAQVKKVDLDELPIKLVLDEAARVVGAVALVEVAADAAGRGVEARVSQLR